MTTRIESRHKKRWWLPKFLPGNVYAMVVVDEMSVTEASEAATLARDNGAFAVLVEFPDGSLLGLGGIRL